MAGLRCRRGQHWGQGPLRLVSTLYRVNGKATYLKLPICDACLARAQAGREQLIQRALAGKVQISS